jgi:hypothetical protein
MGAAGYLADCLSTTPLSLARTKIKVDKAGSNWITPDKA